MNSKNYKKVTQNLHRAVDRFHPLRNSIVKRINEHINGKILTRFKSSFHSFFFYRWLRRKYEQSREEQRQLRIESRRLRRRQRRSIKRFQLHQDLQLARSFGYS